MSEAFVTLWSLDRCRWLSRAGDVGPIEVIFGGPHISLPSLAAVRPGDTIFPVSVRDGALFVVAQLLVQRLMPPEEYIRERHGIDAKPNTLWDSMLKDLEKSRPTIGHRFPTTCADSAAVGIGSEIRFDRMFPSVELHALRLGPKTGKEKALSGLVEGSLKSSHAFQGHVRRLSSESARALEELVGWVAPPPN